MAASSNVWEVYECPVTGRYYDPFRVLSALHKNADGKLNDLVKARDTDPAAALHLADAGRRAFGLPAVDPASGSGVPDAVVLQAVEKFAEYARGKGSGAGNWRTWSRQRDPQASLAPKTTSPSGSTSDISKYASCGRYPKLSE